MNRTAYIPHPGSLADLVIRFFERNPDEDLTVDDIVVKFCVPRENLVAKLRPAVAAGYLRQGKTGAGVTLWSRGPRRPGESVQQPKQAPKQAPANLPAPRPEPKAFAARTVTPAQASTPAARPPVATFRRLPIEGAGLRCTRKPTGDIVLERDGVTLVLTRAEAAEVVAATRRTV